MQKNTWWDFGLIQVYSSLSLCVDGCGSSLSLYPATKPIHCAEQAYAARKKPY